MFTGIIEEIGKVIKINKNSKSLSLDIEANKVLKDSKLGDSISTNGICLTITKIQKTSFSVDVMYETVNRSTIRNYKLGTTLNLERALLANSRMGGHYVSGHVDGVGKIINIDRIENALVYRIQASNDILDLMIEKGSVAIDGISLTIVNVYVDSFEVSIIPHTLKDTIMRYKGVNDEVNLETDVMGKYIKKFLTGINNKQKIDEKFLINNGFF